MHAYGSAHVQPCPSRLAFIWATLPFMHTHTGVILFRANRSQDDKLDIDVELSIGDA